jgi:hypothetical protein
MCLGGDLAKDFVGARSAHSLAAKIRVVRKIDWRRIVAALAASASVNSPFTHGSGWWGYFCFFDIGECYVWIEMDCHMSPAQVFCGGPSVGGRQCCSYVNDLIFPAHLPATVGGAGISESDISAGLEPVRDGSAVFALGKPDSYFRSHCLGNYLFECQRGRSFKTVDNV